MVSAGEAPISNMQAHTKIGCAALKTGDTTMFTKSVIALAIILGITSGAFAAPKKHQDNSNPALAYGAVTSGPLAATKQRQHSPNPAWDVYDTSGHYVGSDPDPNVRMQLQMDQGGEW
jgi:hypothetical protein